MKSFKTYYNLNTGTLITEAVGMTPIKHLHQLTPVEFMDIFANQTPFELTTKMDGSNWSCGVVDGKTYVKSKKGKQTTKSSDFYAIGKKTGNEIFDGFGRSLDMLNTANFKSWYDKTKTKYQKDFQKKAKTTEEVDFTIFAEIFPMAQINSIVYNAEDIGDGALVVFGLKLIDGSSKGIESSTGKQFIKIMKDFVDTFASNSSGWKVYYKSSVPLKIDDSAKNAIIDFVKKNGDAMKSRKRDPETLLAKSTALGEFKKMLDTFKGDLISQFKKLPSFLSNEELEGVILRNMDNEQMTKIVDVDKFTSLNMKNWASRKELVNEKQDLYKRIIEEVFNSADILLIRQKQAEKITNYLEVKGVYKLDTIDELLLVLYDDAKDEVSLSSAKDMVKNIETILEDYKDIVRKIIKKTEETQKDDDKKLDDYNFKSTLKNLEVEIVAIDKFITDLKGRTTGNSAWAKAFEFILGPKVVEELVKKFIK